MTEALIVEEQWVLAQTLDALLWRWGYEVRVAKDAGLALSAVNLKLPDVIVTEVDLSGLDGLQLTRALKAEARTRAIPVIAMSADDREMDATAAGCSGFVRTPVDTQRLLALLRILAPIS